MINNLFFVKLWITQNQLTSKIILFKQNDKCFGAYQGTLVSEKQKHFLISENVFPNLFFNPS